MNRVRTRAALLMLGAIVIPAGLTACTGGLPTNLSGTVKVTQVIQTKHSCTVKVSASNGKSYTANIGPAFKCIGLKAGRTFTVVKGQVKA